VVVQALYDAADDDSATGGPDVARRIYPIVTVITEDGFRRLTDDESSEIAVRFSSGGLSSPTARGPRCSRRFSSCSR
jgi:proteasome beta subunit